MLPVRAAAKNTGVKPRDMKGILPLMIIMVIIFLLLLLWENEVNEEIMQVSSLEHLHVDYPQSDIPVRYCNYMIIEKVIREPDYTCKKKHVFIHERPRKINSICTSPKKAPCQNHSTTFCFQSETKFQMTVCQLIEGTRYPACRYHISLIEGFVLVTCDDLRPVNFQGYVE
ncbi:probable inactive ribonuclease-like protein 12 [Lemur catta]|uniref:probable inactive ribonuclease-like protein 12 n=1 Tax=Lemur catta TaxID=9447 RepID=UPI001E26698B|nr:probable inactive ribonuclease-like protein 12 [Lemur catta]